MLRRNVVLVHSGALGDFVVTWPIAMALARLMAQSRVMYVTHASKGQLAERAIGVEWRDADQFSGLFAAGASVHESARKTIAGATHIVSFVSDGVDAWAQSVKALAPQATCLFVSPRPALKMDVHITEFHRQQLSTWPGLMDGAEQMARHIATRGVSPRAGEENIVTIHPGSGGEKKRWPVEKFARVAMRLQAKSVPVRFVIGEVELDRWPADQIAQLRDVAPLVTPSTLVDLHDALRTSRVFLGNDSGPAHLAAAVGTKTFTLFGPEGSSVMWKPLGPAVHLIEAPDLDSLHPDRVVDEILSA
jgi:heptosyltransferase III